MSPSVSVKVAALVAVWLGAWVKLWVVISGWLVSVGVGSVESTLSLVLSGLVPSAEAVLSTLPALMSLWVREYSPVKVVVSSSLGSRSTGPPVTVTLGSETLTAVRVVLPVFLTVKL